MKIETNVHTENIFTFGMVCVCFICVILGVSNCQRDVEVARYEVQKATIENNGIKSRPEDHGHVYNGNY